MSTTLQRKIKRHLSKQKISVAEFERRTGFKHAVMNILHGRSKHPTVRVAQAIAKELGCSVEELLQDKLKLSSSTSCKEIPNDKPWHHALYFEIVSFINEWLEKNGMRLSFQEARQAIDAIYEYALETPNQTLDQRFARWYLKNTFPQKEKG